MIDIHNPSLPVPGDAELKLYREKMYAFIFPNSPVTEEETQAFEGAVLCQYEHDMTLAKNRHEVPEGVQSFTLGDFSMSFKDDFWDARLNMKNICPSAYGLLLRHGLLYRGVEGRARPWP